MDITMKAIGFINSPYKDRKDIPKQSVLEEGVSASIKLEKNFIDGIYGYKKGDNLIILFNFHKSKGDSPMIIKPHGRDEEMGVFKTRSPHRPNGIGMTIVEIIDINHERGEVFFDGVDMLDGTPVLDLKPYSKKLNP